MSKARHVTNDFYFAMPPSLHQLLAFVGKLNKLHLEDLDVIRELDRFDFRYSQVCTESTDRLRESQLNSLY
jgi:hypothetical protein